MPETEILADASALAERAAELFVTLAAGAIARQGRFCAALSGGSTPLGLYARLVQPPYASLVDWSKIHLFWGDERCVPPEHPDSNYGAAWPVLLERALIPAANIHRIPGELEPALAARSYEQTLAAFFGRLALPCLDLVLLGLGDDGHTASLFPGSPAVAEKLRWVVEVEHRQPPTPLVSRVTLTPPVLNAAACGLFLVSGAAKANRLVQVLKGPYQPEILPAQIVRPQPGRLIWLADHAAAQEL